MCIFHGRASRSILFVWILMLPFLFTLSVKCRSVKEQSEMKSSQTAFNNGDFVKAIELAGIVINKVNIQSSTKLKGLEVIAYSQTSLGKFDEAERTIQDALKIVNEPASVVVSNQKAGIYFCASWLKRSQRQFPEAIDFSRKALSVAPKDLKIQGEYYLNIGRILFSLGFDVSAIIWLEKAEKILSREKSADAQLLEIYRYLSHTWYSKANTGAALNYSEKLVKLAEKTEYKFKYRQALFESGNHLSAVRQKAKAFDCSKEVWNSPKEIKIHCIAVPF